MIKHATHLTVIFAIIITFLKSMVMGKTISVDTTVACSPDIRHLVPER